MRSWCRSSGSTLKIWPMLCTIPERPYPKHLLKIIWQVTGTKITSSEVRRHSWDRQCLVFPKKYVNNAHARSASVRANDLKSATRQTAVEDPTFCISANAIGIRALDLIYVKAHRPSWHDTFICLYENRIYFSWYCPTGWPVVLYLLRRGIRLGNSDRSWKNAVVDCTWIILICRCVTAIEYFQTGRVILTNFVVWLT